MNNKKFGKVAVLFGGNSNEREISISSGKSVLKSLKKSNIDVIGIDPNSDNLDQLKQFDRVFICLHGKDGEDGVAQSYFEYLKIPYTHSGVISSFNAMDKIISKEIFLKNKIRTPKYFSIKKTSYKKNIIQRNIKNSKINKNPI